MTRGEIAAIESLIKAVPSWVSKSHYTVRSRERRIARIEVFQAVRYGEVIEAKDDNRVVMRHHSGVCVVLSVPDHTVVTVWYNAPEDQHYTLDLSQYRWSIDLTKWSPR